ncbi:hypothetical protein C5167_035059 [Papaver somniferum]|uniref:Uncharacterized protein n=1 Tax=Papaver somniferum TaxID=3469 RepID=A0A4Y7KJ36_PAPSO|nr:hypothetical protein C5167_035059 [Papaver somniferum]
MFWYKTNKNLMLEMDFEPFNALFSSISLSKSIGIFQGFKSSSKTHLLLPYAPQIFLFLMACTWLRKWIIRPFLNVLIFEELKGAVANAFFDFTTPPINDEYNCLINAIMDPSGCYTMYTQYFGDVSLGNMIRRNKTPVVL